MVTSAITLATCKLKYTFHARPNQTMFLTLYKFAAKPLQSAVVEFSGSSGINSPNCAAHNDFSLSFDGF